MNVQRVSYCLDGEELASEPIAQEGLAHLPRSVVIEGQLYSVGWLDVREPDTSTVKASLYAVGPLA